MSLKGTLGAPDAPSSHNQGCFSLKKFQESHTITEKNSAVVSEEAVTL